MSKSKDRILSMTVDVESQDKVLSFLGMSLCRMVKPLSLMNRFK